MNICRKWTCCIVRVHYYFDCGRASTTPGCENGICGCAVETCTRSHNVRCVIRRLIRSNQPTRYYQFVTQENEVKTAFTTIHPLVPLTIYTKLPLITEDRGRVQQVCGTDYDDAMINAYGPDPYPTLSPFDPRQQSAASYMWNGAVTQLNLVGEEIDDDAIEVFSLIFASVQKKGCI